MAFQEQDAAIFFGRGEEILKTLETLDALRRQGREAARFALLLGASGSGKSSLARAGVLPGSKRNPPNGSRCRRSVPSRSRSTSWPWRWRRRSRPWAAARLDRDSDRAAHGGGAKPIDGLALLNLARDLAIAARQPETTVLLTIDQAEELFGYNPPEAATRFLRFLRAALEAADRRLMAMATLRSDFLGEFQSHPVLQDSEYPHHFRYRAVPVDPMPLRNFPAIIQGPARLAGVQLDDGLVEAMVDDTGTRDALPLLAFTLRRLYERYADDSRLTVAESETLGGLEAAIREEASGSSRRPTLRRKSSRRCTARSYRPWYGSTPRAAMPAAALCSTTCRAAPSRCSGASSMRASWSPTAIPRSRRPSRSRTKRYCAPGRCSAAGSPNQDKLRLLESIQRSAEEWDQCGGWRDNLLVHRNGRLKDAEALPSQSALYPARSVSRTGLSGRL